MMGPHRCARRCAWMGVACFTATLATSAPARASSDGGYGILFAAATGFGVAAAATPYLVAKKSPDTGPAGAALHVGAGRHLDAYAFGADLGGYFRKDGVLGWMGRSRFEFSGERTNALPGYIALRLDTVALLKLAGNASGPVILEWLPGLTVWPRFVRASNPGAKTHAFAAIGPTLGLRLRAQSKSPHFLGDVEVDYAPLAGAPITGRFHNLEVGTAFGFTPWPDASGAVAFELRSRVELGLGGADPWRTAGITLVGGVRLRLDLLYKNERR